MKRLLAVAVMALATAAPAYGYYADDGGGNRPDCTGDNLGWWWGGMECGRDPFAPPDTGYQWHWGN